MRGKPLSSVIYSKDNKIQSITNYYYCEDKANDYFVFTSNMFLQHFISGCRFFTGGIYKLYYPKYDVIKKDVIHNYDNGTDTITNKYIRTNYSIPIYYPYVHFADIRLLSEEHQMNNNDSQFQRFTYQITSNNNDGFNNSFLLSPQQVDSYRNGNMIKSEKTFYDYFDVYLSSESGSAYWNTIFAPSYIEETVNGETRRIATFKEYTFSGALKKLNYKGKNIEYEWKYSWWLIGKNFGGVDCAVKKKIEGDGILETQSLIPQHYYKLNFLST